MEGFRNYSQKARRFALIKKKFLDRLNQGDFEEIKYYLRNSNESETEEFFRMEGYGIFFGALINASSCKPLDFLINNVPKNIVELIIKKDNFDLLGSFLGGYNLMVKYGKNDQEEDDLAISKTKLLISLKDQEIHKFIESNCGSWFH